MITRTVKTVNIEISLSEGEARWLLGYLQNSPQGFDESESDHYTRCDMFETLKEALIAEPPQAPTPPPIRLT